jgi:hypothetical protein
LIAIAIAVHAAVPVDEILAAVVLVPATVNVSDVLAGRAEDAGVAGPIEVFVDAKHEIVRKS